MDGWMDGGRGGGREGRGTDGWMVITVLLKRQLRMLIRMVKRGHFWTVKKGQIRVVITVVITVVSKRLLRLVIRMVKKGRLG